MKILRNILLACSVLLLVVWPLNGTTGMKNLLVLSGSVCALFIWRIPSAVGRWRCKPFLAFLLLFLLWLVFQALVVSPYPEVASRQLYSVWLSAALAAFMGLALGSVTQAGTIQRKILIVGLQIFPFCYLLNFAYVSYSSGIWTIPVANTDLGVYGDKIKIIFFGLIALATSIQQIATSLGSSSGTRQKLPLLSVACLFSAFLSFILVGSKSGVMQGLIVFLAASLVTLLRYQSRNLRIVLLLAGALFVTGAIWQLKNDEGWSNFSYSIRAGLDLNTYDSWKNYPENGLPKIEGKYQVQESAYLRTAGLKIGLICLISEPLGHGHMSEPIRYTRNTCDLAKQTKIFTTLSALFDFTLVVGLPGVALFLAMFLATFRTRQSDGQDVLVLNKMIPLAMLVTWIFSEVTDTHYYESTLFLLGLLSMANLQETAKPTP